MTNLFASRMGTGAGMLLLGLLLTAANGCGSNDTGNVSGTVTFQGKPMPGGYVNFYSVGRDGKVVDQKTGPIDEKGNYSVAKVRIGDNKITVQAPLGELQPNMTKKGTLPQRGKPPVMLPRHYEDVEKTDMKYTVRPGNQTYEIALK